MQVNQVGFESRFKQHLDAEQRRAVLEAIGARINPDSTIGEVLDAAEALGWSEQMSDLSLADLAEALLAPEEPADEDEYEAEDEAEDEAEYEDEDDEYEYEYEYEDEDEDEDEFELEVQEPEPPRKRASSRKKATKATATNKSPAKKAAKAKGKAAKKSSSKKAAKGKAAKKISTKRGRRKTTTIDVDERMSLEQAAEFFLPHVEALGEATMQALEEQTGVTRRKLRFHIGQLVKHGYLERHGMGRGTFYTLV